MKVYTLIIMEMGIIDIVKTFKTKKSAYAWMISKGYDAEVVDGLAENAGIWNDDDVEINLVANRMIEK